MKKFLGILICLLTLQNLGLLLAQQDAVLVFKGYLDTSPDASQTLKPCLERTERLSSDFGGIIEVQLEAGMSEEMQYCIKAAAQLWEEKLYIPKKVLLRFRKERMGVAAADFEAQVRYSSLAGTNEIYPQSYYMNFLTDNVRESEDAMIRINEDVDWDFSFSKKNVGKKNLTTAMLRAIAMSLGVGSTVIDNPMTGITFLVSGCFSPFDNLVINSNNISLNKMPNDGRTSEELQSFVKGDNVYYRTLDKDNFKLYASPDFKGYNYLSCFDTEGDLMSYNMKIGDKNQQVDANTLEVLEMIGWKVPESRLIIKAAGIDDTGMASALQNYSFHAETTFGDITEYSWKYELLNANMDYESIKVGESAVFTIDKVDDLTKYYKNVNGDIKGRITLNACVGGKKESKVFHVFLATRPTFISVKVDAITPIPGTNYYNLDITAIYTGADFLYAEQTEEISSIGITTYAYEPYIAHLHFENIYKIGMAWVDLTLKNQIGEAYHTVEIPSQTSVGIDANVIMNSEISNIAVRDLQGRLILQTKDYEKVDNLPKGVYILTIKYEDGKSVNQKICR